jgi:hypothetical protein
MANVNKIAHKKPVNVSNVYDPSKKYFTSSLVTLILFVVFSTAIAVLYFVGGSTADNQNIIFKIEDNFSLKLFKDGTETIGFYY